VVILAGRRDIDKPSGVHADSLRIMVWEEFSLVKLQQILLLRCTAISWFDVTINLLEEVVRRRIVAVVDVGRREDVALVAIVICDLQR